MTERHTTISKSVLRSIFERKGGWGVYTLPFEDFPQSMQQEVLSKVRLQVGEEPVIGSIKGSDHWILITTARVILYSTNEIKWVDNSRIIDATVDLASDGNAKAETKMQLSHLKIVTDAGEEIPLETEPGAPYFGVWNLLKHLAARSDR